jgi:hypothetical protein
MFTPGWIVQRFLPSIAPMMLKASRVRSPLALAGTTANRPKRPVGEKQQSKRKKILFVDNFGVLILYFSTIY